MKATLPSWGRWLALGAGLMDTATGAGLVLLPALTLRLMSVPPPGAEALGFVRFIGVFVGSVGLSYLLAWRRDERTLRVVFDFTRIFRAGAGVFTGVMVLGAGWPPAWLAVTAADLGLVVAQTALLSRVRDE